MVTVELNKILQTHPDYDVAGECLYAIVNENIGRNEKVVVDMRGVTSIPSIFLNVSIGRIIDELGMDTLRHFISFAQITKSQAERIKCYLENYKI